MTYFDMEETRKHEQEFEELHHKLVYANLPMDWMKGVVSAVIEWRISGAATDSHCLIAETWHEVDVTCTLIDVIDPIIDFLEGSPSPDESQIVISESDDEGVIVTFPAS